MAKGSGRRTSTASARRRSSRATPSSPGACDHDEVGRQETRKRVARALQMLRNKRVENPWKKHDNIPL
jgi:propionyl-CoA carboxylase beta chain